VFRAEAGDIKVEVRQKQRQKGKARLKPIREEVVELIKPAKTHLSYIDLNNDPYLIFFKEFTISK
jgi:hypothetical protein